LKTTHTSPPRESLAGTLMQAFSAVREVAGIVPDLGEQSTVRAEFVVTVHSDAEVDGAAASFGVTPERTSTGTYRAVKRDGQVTVVVVFFPDPTAPASAAMPGAVHDMAGTVAGAA
jgi:hypothetical protein